MFDRYSERARRVLFFARYELSQCGGETIDPAHLLLGMLRDAKTADRQFASRNISPADLRRTIEQRVRRGARLATLAEAPFAPATKRVLKFAAEEADRLLQHIVQPEHLLLALLREDDPVAAASLIDYGLGLDETREHIVSRSPTRIATADTKLGKSNPLAAAHIERIRQLVRELAQADSNTEDGQTLVGRIDDELTMLMSLPNWSSDHRIPE